MKINQTNYEHYFLMYIDNELSEQEKAAVDEFNTLNPYFAKELQDLQKTKIKPSTIIFKNKLSLYKISEQDEKCFSYLDNEMPQLERNTFEKNLKNDNLLNTTLHEWRKTILTKEAPNKIDPDFKNRLYKKEATLKPIWSNISIKQWASVAAILLLVISVSLYQQNNSKNNFKSIAQIDKDVLQQSSQMNGNDLKTSQPDMINTNDPNNNNNTSNTIAVGIGNLPTNHQFVKNSRQYQGNILHNTATKNIPLQFTHEETPIEKISYASRYDIAANSQVLQTESNNIHATPESYTLISKASISDAQDEIENNIDAKVPFQMQYNNIETEDEDDVIYIANMEIDGSRLREVSRKISAIFKRNKPENNKYK